MNLYFLLSTSFLGIDLALLAIKFYQRFFSNLSGFAKISLRDACIRSVLDLREHNQISDSMIRTFFGLCSRQLVLSLVKFHCNSCFKRTLAGKKNFFRRTKFHAIFWW